MNIVELSIASSNLNPSPLLVKCFEMLLCLMWEEHVTNIYLHTVTLPLIMEKMAIQACGSKLTGS